MYSEIVDQKIAEYMKNGNKVELAVWRSIKNEFLVFRTAKAGNVLNDEVELKIIQKMLAQHKDSIEQYRAAGRLDLVESEQAEADVLASLLPKEPTEDDIKEAISEAVKSFGEGYAPSMKDMKTVQSYVRSKYPTVNGGVVASLFKTWIS